jgi:hypothetical protein
MSHNPMGLHGLLQGYLTLPYLTLLTSYLKVYKSNSFHVNELKESNQILVSMITFCYDLCLQVCGI